MAGGAEGNAADLFGRLAPHWKKQKDEKLFDKEKLLTKLDAMVDAATETRAVDLDLQALLAMLRAAHASWFTEEEFKKIQEHLDSVADMAGKDWQKDFGSDEEVTDAIKKALRTEETEVTRDDDGIYVEYKNGDYGGASGKHNGRVVIMDDSVCLYNEKKPGVKIQWGGDLPSSADELRAILAKEDWNEVQEEASDDDD